MKKLNKIGINQELSNKLVDKLNILLANYQLFYMNARGFHWNIKGEKFFELHLKFEELYNDALLKVDEIAERILTLDKIPFHAFADYLQASAIKPAKNISDGKKAVKVVVDSLGELLVLEREIFKLAAKAEDEGTNAMMSDYIREQEKLVWMYSAYLEK